MTFFDSGLLDVPAADTWVPTSEASIPSYRTETPAEAVPSQEFLRGLAWHISEGKPTDSYESFENHVGLGMVSPCEGYAHWRIKHDWIMKTAHSRGGAWNHCRMILRIYDVSYIDFNGFNANRVQDHGLPAIAGQFFFRLPRPGTWQIAEVGFVLTSGEFIPAARSQAVPYPPDSPSRQGGHAALLVDARGRTEQISNLWEQDRILLERRRPHLKKALRIAAFATTSLHSGEEGQLSRFVTELAAGQNREGHEVHVFVPATDKLAEDRKIDGIQYHALTIAESSCPLAWAEDFAIAATDRLQAFGTFDLVHWHEWQTTGVYLPGVPAVLSLGSIEKTRRNGDAVTEMSELIETAERDAAAAADRLLTPPELRDRVCEALEVDGPRVVGFAMEGRMANEWECPLDFGEVKKSIHFGPLDRMMIFVGPIEHEAGADLIIEALPTLLHRSNNVRVAFVGHGSQIGALSDRANQLGVGYAVRFLGHVEGSTLTRLLRSSEALIMPSRYRIPFDDTVVDLTRRAGRAVVTTHAGPAHLVKHEETGLVTYDNPGSMVWALDRILGDPGHTEHMGDSGRRAESGAIVWSEVARHYLELCAAWFPQLNEPPSALMNEKD
jgi:glycogen(starch) synthase